MPDYDFFCRKCQESFSAHMSVKEHDAAVPPCPECKSASEVQRMISHFNVQTSRKSATY